MAMVYIAFSAVDAERHLGSRTEKRTEERLPRFWFTMAARMRLKRIGSSNRAAYRVVVMDSRTPRDGRFIDELGTYKPVEKNDRIRIDLERAQYWLDRGVQPSETVASLLKKAKREAAKAG